MKFDFLSATFSISSLWLITHFMKIQILQATLPVRQIWLTAESMLFDFSKAIIYISKIWLTAFHDFNASLLATPLILSATQLYSARLAYTIVDFIPEVVSQLSHSRHLGLHFFEFHVLKHQPNCTIARFGLHFSGFHSLKHSPNLSFQNSRLPFPEIHFL